MMVMGMTDRTMGKTLGKWWFHGDFMGFTRVYPLVMTDITMDNLQSMEV